MNSVTRGSLVAVALAAMLLAPARADFQTGMDAYQREDYAVALREWEALANDGMVEAQFNLGLLYMRGQGADADPAQALEWYRRAADQGYARAQYRVAELYEAGTGTDVDFVQAHLWFGLAREQKYEGAKKRQRVVAKLMSPEEIARSEMLARHRKRDLSDRD